jgi:hypothetical protein
MAAGKRMPCIACAMRVSAAAIGHGDMAAARVMTRPGKVCAAAHMSNRSVAATSGVAACCVTAASCVPATAGMALRQCRSRARQNQS